jgi:glycosyltransferase involved in cell wall biosynthesis
MPADARILHLIETSGPGGAESVFRSHLRFLRGHDRRHEHLAGLIRPGWLASALEKEGQRLFFFPSRGAFDVALVRSLCAFIRRERIRLVHSHLPDISCYSSVAARLCGIPHIATEHGDIRHHSRRSARLLLKYHILSACSRAIACVSQFNREALDRKIPGAWKKSCVVYNGIEIADLPTDNARERIRERLGFERDDVLLCNIANLYPVKGQIFLIRAVAELAARSPRLRLVVIGRGELEGRLKAEVESLGLTDVVHFLGFQENARALLPGMDIFVLSSLSEGLPVSVIEAMAAGLPVVASAVGGIPEINALGAEIVLVRSGDADSLAAGLWRLIAAGRFSSTLNRSAAARHFSVRAMSERYLELYGRLM